jgi:hypothetical protein
MALRPSIVIHPVASNALAMCCGILPGVTSMTSKRMSRCASAGLCASQSSAAALAAFRDRLGRIFGALARFDLDENQRTPPARHNIDLAERRLPATRDDAIALGDEDHRGAAFCRKAEPDCSDLFAARPVERPDRLSAARHR